MASLIIKALFLTTIFLLQYNSIKASLLYGGSSILHSFANDLLPLIAGNKSLQNVVYSPASLYTSLALAYVGAKGRTADELSRVLKLDKDEREYFALIFGRFYKNDLLSYTELLSISNRFFVSKDIQILENFNKIAHKNFHSTAESVDFSQASTVVHKINKWVEDQTKSKIKNFMQPNAINADTTAILVNTIYFMANWRHPFVERRTSKGEFHISSSEKVEVDTMYSKEEYGYAELSDLQAEALELPFEDPSSNYSMLIIFPKDIEGLKKLEEKLAGKDLKEIASRINYKKLEIYLPKFRIEFEIDLKEPLKKLGCSTMFSSDANFNGMVNSTTPLKISEVKQKVFLEVNEHGAEAAAGTYSGFELLSANNDQIVRVNRPFYFAIRNRYGIYFVGHVARLP